MKEIKAKAERLKALRKNLIKEADEEVNRQKAAVESQAINYNKIGTSGIKKNSAEDKTISYIDAVAELNLLIAEEARIKSELKAWIDSKFPGDSNSMRRRIYKFYYIDGMKITDIAETIPCAVGTVKNYLFCEN